jgi:proteasome lid subunit RPN8/RPN11
MKLTITKEAQAVIYNDSLSSYPYECCGFLFGKEENEERIITLAKEVINSKEENKERRFEISSKDYMKAERFADENNLTMLGVYHSHPDHPAVPSEHDLKQALPFFSYVIVSVRKGKLHNILSWRLNDKGMFVEETVITESVNKENINLTSKI